MPEGERNSVSLLITAVVAIGVEMEEATRGRRKLAVGNEPTKLQHAKKRMATHEE